MLPDIFSQQVQLLNILDAPDSSIDAGTIAPPSRMNDQTPHRIKHSTNQKTSSSLQRSDQYMSNRKVYNENMSHKPRHFPQSDLNDTQQEYKQKKTFLRQQKKVQKAFQQLNDQISSANEGGPLIKRPQPINKSMQYNDQITIKSSHKSQNENKLNSNEKLSNKIKMVADRASSHAGPIDYTKPLSFSSEEDPIQQVPYPHDPNSSQTTFKIQPKAKNRLNIDPAAHLLYKKQINQAQTHLPEPEFSKPLGREINQQEYRLLIEKNKEPSDVTGKMTEDTAKTGAVHPVKTTSEIKPRYEPAIKKIQAYFRMKQARAHYLHLKNTAQRLQRVRQKVKEIRVKEKAPIRLAGTLMAIFSVVERDYKREVLWKLRGDIIHYVTQSDINTSRSRSKSAVKVDEKEIDQKQSPKNIKDQYSKFTTNTKANVEVHRNISRQKTTLDPQSNNSSKFVSKVNVNSSSDVVSKLDDSSLEKSKKIVDSDQKTKKDTSNKIQPIAKLDLTSDNQKFKKQKSNIKVLDMMDQKSDSKQTSSPSKSPTKSKQATEQYKSDTYKTEIEPDKPVWISSKNTPSGAQTNQKVSPKSKPSLEQKRMESSDDMIQQRKVESKSSAQEQVKKSFKNKQSISHSSTKNGAKLSVKEKQAMSANRKMLGESRESLTQISIREAEQNQLRKIKTMKHSKDLGGGQSSRNLSKKSPTTIANKSGANRSSNIDSEQRLIAQHKKIQKYKEQMEGIESGQDDIEPIGAIMNTQSKKPQEQKKEQIPLYLQTPRNNHGNSFASLQATNLKEIAIQVERDNEREQASLNMRKIQSSSNDRGRTQKAIQSNKLDALGTISSASSPESVKGTSHLKNADEEGYESITDHRPMQDLMQQTQNQLLLTRQNYYTSETENVAQKQQFKTQDPSLIRRKESNLQPIKPRMSNKETSTIMTSAKQVQTTNDIAIQVSPPVSRQDLDQLSTKLNGPLMSPDIQTKRNSQKTGENTAQIQIKRNSHKTGEGEMSLDNNRYDSDHKAMNISIKKTNKAGWEYRLEHDMEGRLDKPQQVQNFGGTGDLLIQNQRAMSSSAIIQQTRRDPSRKKVKHDEIESSISEDSKEYLEESRSDEVIIHDGMKMKVKSGSPGKKLTPLHSKSKTMQNLPVDVNMPQGSKFHFQSALNTVGNLRQQDAHYHSNSLKMTPDFIEKNNYLTQNQYSKNQHQSGGGTTYMVGSSSMNESSVGITGVDLPFIQNQGPFRSLDVSALGVSPGGRSTRRRKKSPKKRKQQQLQAETLPVSPQRHQSRPRKPAKKARKSPKRQSQSPQTGDGYDDQFYNKRRDKEEIQYKQKEIQKGRKRAKQRAAAVNRSVQLPRITNDTDTEFVKMFIEKNNRQYKQPKQKKVSSGPAEQAQPRKGPRQTRKESVRDLSEHDEMQDFQEQQQDVNALRAKILQESVRQQQLQIKSMTEMQNKILRGKARQGIDQKALQELQRLDQINRLHFQHVQSQFMPTSGDEAAYGSPYGIRPQNSFGMPQAQMTNDSNIVGNNLQSPKKSLTFGQDDPSHNEIESPKDHILQQQAAEQQNIKIKAPYIDKIDLNKKIKRNIQTREQMMQMKLL